MESTKWFGAMPKASRKSPGLDNPWRVSEGTRKEQLMLNMLE
jgi:hypothetical protein